MTRRLHVAALIAFAVLVAISATAASPQATAKVRLDQLLSLNPTDVSPVFLSDESVALLARSGAPTPNAPTVVVLSWTRGQLQSTAGPRRLDDGSDIYSASNSLLIIASPHHKYVYSADLEQKWDLPIHLLSSLFPRSGLVGEFSERNWKAFLLTPEPTLIEGGQGMLLSTSDGILISQGRDAIRTETTSRKLLGAAPVQPGARYFRSVEFAGSGRLYFSTRGDERIADFNGKQLQRVRPPEGWGFRHGWSSDGSRLLFDHFIRSAPVWERAFDRLLGVPEESNGEIIKVVDVNTGEVCFDLGSPNRLLGAAGGYHADLSPSGRWVAVASPTDLSIYRLPDHCTTM